MTRLHPHLFALLLALIITAGTAGRARSADVIVIPKGSTWLYHAQGMLPDSLWATPGYVDTAWTPGLAPLGYGEPYIVTTVPHGPDSLGNKFRTTYFRIHFTIADDPGDVTSLIMNANHDDGFVAYLNGVELARRNMPAGPIVYGTFAGDHEGGVCEAVLDLTGTLTAGDNVLAVELHQVSPGSSDLVLDFEFGYSTHPNLVRGPYLQMGTPTRQTFRWRTDVPTASWVRFGPAPDSLTAVVSDTTQTTEHIVEVDALNPKTRYYYAVGTADTSVAGDDSLFFNTAPRLKTRERVRTWIVGDSGQGNVNAESVRDGYKTFAAGDPADLFIMLGDNAYPIGTDIEYQKAVFRMYPEVLRTTPLWTTRGNHDAIHSGPNNDYYDIFTLPTGTETGGVTSGTEAYYSFDHDNIHFICLDSQGSFNSPAMYTWLKADLMATPQEWVIAFWHHPPYSAGGHHSDSTLENGRLITMREDALPILEAGGVDVVFTGHSHSYERSFLLDEHYGLSGTLHDSMKVDAGDGKQAGDGAYMKPTPALAPHEGAVYVVAGSSSQLTPGPLDHPVMIHASLLELGSVVVDVDRYQLDAYFINTAGTVRDEFTIIKGNPTGTGDSPQVLYPTLSTSFPNPFTYSARVRYTLPERGPVRVDVFDVQGRRLASLVDAVEEAGPHEAVWDGRDSSGRPVAGGVYFTVLDYGGEIRARKLILQP